MQLTSFSLLLLPALAAADCTRNGDAGRWVDDNSPAAALQNLCNAGKEGCYQATGQGNMCIKGDMAQCNEMSTYATNQQSYHDDWFLWSSIICGGLTMTIQ